MYYCISMRYAGRNIQKFRFFIILAVILLTQCSLSQLKDENVLLKWGSWALLQTIPSPVFFDDRNDLSTGIKFGLQWHVVPVSYSFNSNKYVSPFNFFLS